MPLPGSLVVNNGSIACLSTSGLMPCPVSLTVSITYSPGRAFAMRAGGIGIKCDVAGLDREHAAFGHGVPRVDRKVEDRIIDIAGIGRGLARVGRQPQRDGDLFAERSPQQLNRARDAIIEIQSLQPDAVRARKDEQPAGEAGTHLDCIHRVLDHLRGSSRRRCEA